jgi:hypothetical protein
MMWLAAAVLAVVLASCAAVAIVRTGDDRR